MDDCVEASEIDPVARDKFVLREGGDTDVPVHASPCVAALALHPQGTAHNHHGGLLASAAPDVALDDGHLLAVCASVCESAGRALTDSWQNFRGKLFVARWNFRGKVSGGHMHAEDIPACRLPCRCVQIAVQMDFAVEK